MSASAIPDDRVCIVTGGGAGIGRACVDEFARQGWHVLAADVDEGAALDAAAVASNAHGKEALGVRCDVADAQSCGVAAAKALARWGRDCVYYSTRLVRGQECVSETLEPCNLTGQAWTNYNRATDVGRR